MRVAPLTMKPHPKYTEGKGVDVVLFEDALGWSWNLPPTGHAQGAPAELPLQVAPNG